MKQQYIQILINFPRTALTGWLILSAVLTTGCLWLKFDFSPESVYSGQDEIVAFCNRHKQLFRFEDSVCLVVLESTDGRSLLRGDCFRWLDEFCASVSHVDNVEHVSSLATLQRPRIDLNAALRDTPVNDPIRWGPLLTASDLSTDERISERLDRLPLLNDLLISDDRTLLLTVVTLDSSLRGIGMITPPVEAIEQIIHQSQLPSATRVRLSGVPPIRIDIIRSLERDQTMMVPICAFMFVVVSAIMFRSLIMTSLSLLAVMLAVGNTVGLMGWTGQPFNLLSNVVPPLALIIAAANAVHIVNRFQKLIGAGNRPVREVTLEVMNEMSVTCFLTLATTAIGFGSLLLARSELLRTLAIQASVSMLFSYCSLIIVLTSGLTIAGDHLRLQAHRAAARASQRYTQLRKVTGRVAPVFDAGWAWIIRNAVVVVVLHVILAGATLWWVRDMQVNSFIFETYEADNPAMETVHLLDEKLSGIISLEVQIQAEDPDEFFSPEVASGLQQFRKQMSEDRRVTFYRDYLQVLAAIDARSMSDDPGIAAAALRRIRRVTNRYDLTPITRDFLSEPEKSARIMMRVHDVGSAGLKELIADVELRLRRNMPATLGCHVTGDAALHAVCMDEFVRDLFVSLIAASGVIFALIAVLFRSIRTGLVASVPNLFPLVMTVGWMQLRGFELTAGNVIVFAISLGIAVDDTIHFLARFRQESELTGNRQKAVWQTILTSRKAIVLTSILIVCGLSVLFCSDFVPTRRFAELTAITMLAALPGDLVLLPALLALFGRCRGPADSPPELTLAGR
ncbi:MAG: MMPL family transporter [Planctomycetaceae bacterium]|nr:MMPL family transporter [Planctomycetaceae bacterium]